MASLAFKVLEEAVQAAGKADALAIKMEPLLEKRYGDSAIYAYTNRRAVPPGDVLLAAASAAGISVDEKLGIGRQPSETERQIVEMQDQMAKLRDQVADLQVQLMDLQTSVPEAAEQKTERPGGRTRQAG